MAKAAAAKGSTHEAKPAAKRAGGSPRADASQASHGAAQTINPLWHSMATAVVQRMCAACEEEQRDDQAPRQGPVMQPRLAISAPDDADEREAEAVADRVMRSPANANALTCNAPALTSVQRSALNWSVQRLCTRCASDEQPLQRLPDRADVQAQNSLEHVQQVLASPGFGSALDPHVRQRAESVLRADLSAVRVFSDDRAQQAARDINARAFTHGNNIFLGAGQSASDVALMAHELTHTVQQGASPVVRRKPQATDTLIQRRGEGEWYDVDLPSLGEVAAGIGNAATSAYDTAADVAGGAYDTATQAAGVVQNAVAGIGSDVLNSALALATALGGSVSVVAGRVVITVPTIEFCPVTQMPIALPDASYNVPLVGGGFSVGAVSVLGSVGLNFSFRPTLTAILGPCQLRGVRIEIDPLTLGALASGTVSVSAALTQLNVARAAVRASVEVIVVIPIGGVPVPVKIPVAELEAGGQLALRLSGGGTLATAVSLVYAGGRLSLDVMPTLALGGAIDVDLAAFARLALLGQNLCEFVWPLYHWDASIAQQWSLPLSLSYGSGGVGLSVGTLTSMPVPFDQAVQGVSRTPPSTQCPLIDNTCVIMRALGLLPSQRGVGWRGHPPPAVPTPCNTHPDAPYVEDPLIASGAKCRGVCGVDCAKSCAAEPDEMRCAETAGGLSHYVCDYKGVQDCGTHQGCRDHDACYDHCAAAGNDSILFDSCYRWCDMGCACEHDINTCVGWALGNPPFDGRMRFYDESRSVMHGPFPGPCPAGVVVITWVYDILRLGDAAAMVDALAALPVQRRFELVSDPLALQLLEFAIGLALWPTALRILRNEASVSVPSLDEATVFRADQAIQRGDHGVAFGVVLNTMVARGMIDTTLAAWSHVARADRGEGLTTFTLQPDPATGGQRAIAPVDVEIYTPAFGDVGLLFSTMMHENLHVLQVLAGYGAAEFDAAGNQRAEFVERDEVEAYLWEIEHAVGTGLVNNVAQMQDLGRRLTDHFNGMTAALQAQYRARYDAAQQRVRDVVAGRPGLSIDEARRIVQASSAEIAELLRQRPGREAAIDAQIDAVRRRREAAMVEVALVDNPSIQVVRPGDPGMYRVPTLDADGRVHYLYGGIQVAWHMAAASSSAYTLGGALGAGGEMAIAGTAIQGRVHPFPPDIDFDEHIDVVANTLDDAGRIAAQRIIDSIRRISGGAAPGRTDIEFRHLLTFPGGGRGIRMSLGQVLAGNAVRVLGRAIASLNGGNMNTFWRGFLEDPADPRPANRRFTDITRVVFVSARRPDGTVLMQAGGNADFNLAYLEPPGQVPRTSLGEFAWAMCCDAVRRANAGKWLKAGKRAYNYFSTIGDTAHMAALEPVFRRPEARVEQFASVIESIKHVLSTRDMNVRQPRTRILTVDEARRQVERVAHVVETELPYGGVGTRPDAISRDLRVLASHLRARNLRGQLAHDDLLAASFGREADEIRRLVDAGVRGQVQPIIDGVIRSVCPPDTCR